jgi:hypothetical protein
VGRFAIRVKLDRAKEHAEVFKAEVDRFAAEKPYPFHVVTLYGNNIYDVEWVRNPPARWGAIAGDCVHNLRSALDHIAWDLASDGDGNAPYHTEFPIFVDREKFFQRTKAGEPARGSGLRKIDAITDLNLQTAIKRLQPFQSEHPTRHPLWILHELDNLDKHRALRPVTAWAHTDLWRRDIHDLPDLPPGWRQLRATQGPRYAAQMVGMGKVRMKMRYDLAMRVTLPAGTVDTEDNLDVLLDGLIEFVETKVFDIFESDLTWP